MPATTGNRRPAGTRTTDDTPPSSRRPRADDWFSHTLPRNLLLAYTWVDDGLQNYMRAHAAFSLPRAQSMLMVCIGDGIHRQSEMAKVLQVSKQAVRQGIRELTEKALVEIVPDPDNQRSKLVRFTEEGKTIRETARRGMVEVEKQLTKRIGRRRVRLLHELLEAGWGPPPEFEGKKDAG